MKWGEYVADVIGSEAHEKVGAHIGVTGPTVGRWINGETSAPRGETAVNFARHYHLSVIETLLRAGFITEREARGVKPGALPDVSELSNDELLSLVRARMRDDDAPAARPQGKLEREVSESVSEQLRQKSARGGGPPGGGGRRKGRKAAGS